MFYDFFNKQMYHYKTCIQKLPTYLQQNVHVLLQF